MYRCTGVGLGHRWVREPWKPSKKEVGGKPPAFLKGSKTNRAARPRKPAIPSAQLKLSWWAMSHLLQNWGAARAITITCPLHFNSAKFGALGAPLPRLISQDRQELVNFRIAWVLQLCGVQCSSPLRPRCDQIYEVSHDGRHMLRGCEMKTATKYIFRPKQGYERDVDFNFHVVPHGLTWICTFAGK